MNEKDFYFDGIAFGDACLLVFGPVDQRSVFDEWDKRNFRGRMTELTSEIARMKKMKKTVYSYNDAKLERMYELRLQQRIDALEEIEQEYHRRFIEK